MRRRRIGRYRIGHRLGEGGSGVVYLAQIPGGANPPCAIKTIRPSLAADRDFVESLLQEARICARLDHPNIVRLLELGKADGVYFLAMEYVDGISLKELLAGLSRRGCLLPVKLGCFVVSEVARALHFAHHLGDEQDRPLGIVHRDVVPANIMISASGDVKLLDFGIATAAAELRHHRTGSGLIKGTLGYLSPEQAQGRALDGRSDLFSLGVVLHECLTGERVFHGRNSLHSLELLRQMSVTPPSRLRTGVSVALDLIVGTLLSQSPAERLADGQALVDALAPLLAAGEADPGAAASSSSVQSDLGALVLEARGSDPRPCAEVGRGRWTRVLRARRRGPLRWEAVLSLAAFLAALSSAVWLLSTRVPPPSVAAPVPPSPRGLRVSAPPVKRSLAVLRFRNLSDSADAAWISAAVSEILLTKLDQAGRFHPVSREEVVRMQAEQPLPDHGELTRGELVRIGKNLAADLLVTGSVAVGAPAAGGSVRIEVKVLDTQRGDTQAAASGTGTTRELFELADRLGEQLKQKLAVVTVPSPASDQAVRAAIPSDPQAVRWYAEGLDRLRVQDAAAACALLEKAAAAEPHHALTHLALAKCWSLLGYSTRAQAEAKKALSLAASVGGEQRLFISGYVHEPRPRVGGGDRGLRGAFQLRSRQPRLRPGAGIGAKARGQTGPGAGHARAAARLAPALVGRSAHLPRAGPRPARSGRPAVGRPRRQGASAGARHHPAGRRRPDGRSLGAERRDRPLFRGHEADRIGQAGVRPRRSLAGGGDRQRPAQRLPDADG